MSTTQAPTFDISKYPEMPSEFNEFQTATDMFAKDTSQKISILQSPINKLNTKINELNIIQNSYKNFIEKYNKEKISENKEKVESNNDVLNRAKIQLSVQKENLNNMMNRSTAAQTNVGFLMFKPLGPSTYRILQGLTILFGFLIIYMVVTIFYGSAYVNPIDSKVRTTITQVINPIPQTGGAFKKLLKLFKQ